MKRHFEQICWATALLLLFFLNPSVEGPSLCFFKLVGLGGCPGCGIGHSIHHVLHFEFTQAMDEHILGLPATLFILYKVFKPFNPLKQNTNGPTTNAYDAAGTATR